MPNVNEDVQFILRYLPNKKTMKILTQIVDWNRVIKALEWLKANNPHYKHININRDKKQLQKDLESRAITIYRDKNIDLSQGDDSSDDDLEDDATQPSTSTATPSSQGVREPSQANIVAKDEFEFDFTGYAFQSLDGKTHQSQEFLEHLQWIFISGQVINNRMPHLDEMSNPLLFPRGSKLNHSLNNKFFYLIL